MDADFPSNSQQAREGRVEQPPNIAKTRPANQPKELKQITSGAVIQRKKPLGKRFKAMFFGGDARGAISAVAMSVLIPAIKDLIVDGGRELVERAVFGESQYRPRGRWGGAAPGHTRYDGFARAGTPSSAMWGRDRQDPQRNISRKARSTHDFGEIVLESRGEAEQVIDQLYEVLSQYSQVSLSDLYELVGITPAYTDQNYGWTNLQGAGVDHARGGQYLLRLPKPEPLD